MISRERARAIAESAALAHELGGGVTRIYRTSEVTWRLPLLYAGPDLSHCWIAYVDAPIYGLHAATVVLVAAEDGKVLYAGSANDEG